MGEIIGKLMISRSEAGSVCSDDLSEFAGCLQGGLRQRHLG